MPLNAVKVPPAKRRVAPAAGRSVVGVAREPLFKRPLDVGLAAIGLLLSAPLWGMVALAIWLDDGLPILIRQARIGTLGRTVSILKFRSMVHNPDTMEVQASRNDPRITRVGRVLRRTALDELPQLWNILVGDMSFVGPRAQPEMERVRVREVEQQLFIRDVPGFARRQAVRPGLTGIAQLYAPRDVPHVQKFRYDLIYIHRMRRSVERYERARAARGWSRVRGFVAAWVADIEMLLFDCRLIARSIWHTLLGRWEV